MELSFRQLFEAMPCYLSVQDRNFRIIDANRLLREDFGDVEGRYCYNVYKRRPEKCEHCPVELTFRDGKPHHSEERMRPLGGPEISVIINTSPILNEAGDVVAVMEMGTDITEIKAMEDQISESRQRYRLLFEEAPCYVSIQDRDLNVVRTNRRFREDFGEELGGKCYKIYKHRDHECLECPVQETFRDGEVHQSEEVVTAQDGRRVNVMVYAAPLRDTRGEVQRVMEMSANITQIRQLQSKLASIGMLISSISHGVKGLLTGLDGGIYLVNSGLKKDDRDRIDRGWDMVVRNVNRIRSMVMNILYYAKDRDPNWERVTAAEAAREALGVVEERGKRRGVALQPDIDPEAGDFEADPKAFRSLLVNLLENSIDACRVDEKKSEHHIKMEVKGTTDHAEFTIEDNGIGMDQETREKAFSLFFSSKGTEGTGLGLFIANKIAQAHGGTIELSSEVDKGTRFVVRMPHVRPAVAAPVASTSTELEDIL